jgi:hypothetical protein
MTVVEVSRGWGSMEVEDQGQNTFLWVNEKEKKRDRESISLLFVQLCLDIFCVSKEVFDETEFKGVKEVGGFE